MAKKKIDGVEQPEEQEQKAPEKKVWKTVRVHHDDVGAIVACYEPGVDYNIVPEPVIEISAARYEEIRHTRENFVVQSGKIVPKVFSKEELAAKEKAHKETRKHQLKHELHMLDMKRIRPMAEGDSEMLAELNEQAVKLRTELKSL